MGQWISWKRKIFIIATWGEGAKARRKPMFVGIYYMWIFYMDDVEDGQEIKGEKVMKRKKKNQLVELSKY
ncbi:hypothetical protein GCM10011346_25240 [Oceanobacillus neutriphilus]|uniref:Uncharacterized protein n=1 Tax=Oceanobacillus neutriphilus TaxID=531815 RepID=A0ABQ2NVU3_9BACI|nr:hypothetical protein GCM10011346_25240 [Oceanobacillus neutriphilus]